MVKAYRFQRLMIIAAFIVWAGFAAKIVVGGIKGETSNVSDTFCENVYYDLKAEISGVGKLGSGKDRLGGRSADKMMLVAIADKLGISRYEIQEDDEGIFLSQNSVNGSVDIYVRETEQGDYLKISVQLNKGFECAECYRDIIKESFEDYGVDTCVTVSMKGSAIGDMSDKDRDNLADRMLKMLDAKTVTSGKVQDSYMVYAYTKDVKDSISLGKKKINVNITMNYDEIRNMTDITLSTPVYSGDF